MYVSYAMARTSYLAASDCYEEGDQVELIKADCDTDKSRPNSL